VFRLEDQLQAELHNAWRPSAGDLAILAVDPRSGCQRIAAPVAGVGLPITESADELPLRVVESIERLPTELKVRVFTTEPQQMVSTVATFSKRISKNSSAVVSNILSY
jgi:hypothetical protein